MKQVCLCDMRKQGNLIISDFEQNGKRELIFSGGWADFLGKAPKTIDDVLRLVHPDDLDPFETCWRAATKRNIHQQFDCRIKTAGKEYRWLLADLSPLSDGNGVSAIFIDITSRKHSELVFRSDYDLIDLIFNSLHAFIAYVDDQERYQYVNRAYAEFFQRDRSDLCGMTLQEVLGDTYARVEDHVEKAFAGDKVQFEVEVLANNELHRCGIQLIPHYEDGGRVKGVFIYAEEIGDADIIDCHMADLERFLSHWCRRPKELTEFVGRAIGRISYRHLPDLYFAISTSYFGLRVIGERINYIYKHMDDELRGECGQLMAELVEIEKQQGIICLKDVGGKHRGIRMMLLRDLVDGYHTFSVRYFVKAAEKPTGYLKHKWQSGVRPTFAQVLNKLPKGSPQKYENDYDFWNFRAPDNLLHGVIVYPEASGFFDIHESKSVADFIVLASNLLGFDKKPHATDPIMA